MVDIRIANTFLESYDGEKDEKGDIMEDASATCKFVGGHTYIGTFCGNQMHGKGKYVWKDSATFEGSFNFNSIDGSGTYTWPDGSTYTGSVKDGLRNGEGEFRDSKGACYKGGYRQGKRHGYGVLYYNEDESSFYKGEWKDGKRHGHGVMKYPSGNTYDGQWENGERNGKGSYLWVDRNEKYEGSWKKGKQHGLGVHTWLSSGSNVNPHKFQNCNKYEGNFSEGKRQGFGVFEFSSGSRYEGGWKDNLKHGSGIYTFEDGNVFVGEFFKDRMQDRPGMSPRAGKDNGGGAFRNVKSPTVSAERKKTRRRNDKKKLMKTKKKLQKGEVKEIQLQINNLLKDDDQNNEIRLIRNALLRASASLQNIYGYYAALCESDIDVFTMSFEELWIFIQSRNILTPEFSLARVNRIFLEMRLEHFKMVRSAKEKMKGVSKHLLAPELEKRSVHDPKRPLLYRDFLEGIVRIAYYYYDADSLAERVNLFLQKFIIPENISIERNNDEEWNQLRKSAVVQAKFFQHEDELKQIFGKFAKEKNRFLPCKNDKTLFCGEWIELLKQKNINVENPVKLLKETLYGSSDGKTSPEDLFIEITYYELKILMSRLAISDTVSNGIKKLNDMKQKLFEIEEKKKAADLEKNDNAEESRKNAEE
eukprot:g2076.t1